MPGGKEDSIDTKLAKYRELTAMALGKAGLPSTKGTKENMMGKMLLQMAESYYNDAKYFEREGMPLTALAAYSYAHAWLDAGVRLGFLDGKGDSRLFVLP